MAKEMKINEALDIVNAAARHDSTEVLEAVNLLKSESLGHPEYKEVLASFYDSYHDHRKRVESDGNYNDHDIVMQIFGGHEQYHNEYLQRAMGVSQKLAEAEKKKIDTTNLTFLDLDAMQANVRALGISGQNPKTFEAATRKLNATMEYNIQRLDKNSSINKNEFEAIEHFIKNIQNEDTQKKLSELLAKKNIVSSYDEENGILNEVDTLLQNDEKANDILDTVRLYDDEGKITKDFGEIANVLENVSIVDDEGNELDEENRRKHLQILFDAAKVDVHQGAIGTNGAPTHENLVENVKEAFYLKIGQAAVASSIERPNEQDLADEKKFDEYVEKRDAEAIAVMNRLINRKIPIKFNSAQADIAVADTEVDAERFIARLNRKLGDKKTKLEARVNKLGAFAKNLWGNRHEITKAVVKNIKDNKWQHIINVTAGVGVVLLTGAAAPASVAVAAIAGYSAYTAAGGYLWPLRADRQKLQAEAKSQGKKLSWAKAIQQAWNNKKDDKAYKIRRRFGLGGAILGGALGGFGAGLLGHKAGRLLSSLSRGAAGTMAQGGMVAEAKKEYKLNPTEENKSKLTAARTFFGITAVATFATAWFTSKNIDKAANTAVEGSVRGGSGGLLGKLKDILKGRSVEGTNPTSVVDTTSVTDPTDVSGVDVSGVSEFGGPKIPVDVESFNADEKSMFLHSLKHFDGGKATVEGYYDSFRNGWIESLPDGKSPALYVDALSRLQEFSAHPEAVKLMYLELNCEEFHPSDEQRQIIADAINDISYEHGKMNVAIVNECDELEIKEVSRWGQYIGKQKMVEVVVGGKKELMPLRTANSSLGIGAVVDCDAHGVKLHGRVRYGSLPCDKEIVEMAPTPKKATPVIIPEIDCPDLPDAVMAENTAGYQTSGTYLAPIDRYTDYDAAVQHITGESFANNEVAQYIKNNYNSASQAAGFNLKKFIAQAGGELLSDDENGDITFTINRGTVVDTKQGLLDAAHGADIEISMKHDDFVNFAETGELPTRTQSVPLSDENYRAILADENFAFDDTRDDRSYFTTSVEGAEHFSTYAPVDFAEGGKVGQLSSGNDIILSTKQGDVVVHIDDKTGDITAKLGNRPVRFSPESQEAAEKAITSALEARYDVAEVSLAAPEGTLAKKCEMAMQGQSYVPDHVAENITSVGKVNLFNRGGRGGLG